MNKPWFAPKTPMEITPLPWLHEAAISYFEILLQPDWSVLEHGSGGSTLWLAERVARVVTIEHDPAWREAIRSLAPANVTILQTFFLEAKREFDLFFIDGDHPGRATCLTRANLYVKPGGWVVLDNANRPEYWRERIEFAKGAKLMERFDNNMDGGMYYVTEFWQCATELIHY